MNLPRLGRVTSLTARAVWANEPHVFTPWLAQNLDLLAEALELGDLELKDTEVPAGDFRLDILAEGDDGNPVLIENQFGATDHKHLGQLISYVASQGDEATVVWVAERIKEDHRAAIDWLNTNTSRGIDFFAVEVKAIRIGDSDPAPLFEVVAQPNSWARSVGATTRQSGSGELAARHKTRIAYWASFAEYLSAHDPTFVIRRQNKDHWFTFSIGRAGIGISCTISTHKKRIGVELYNHKDPLKAGIRQLRQDQAEIEAIIGEPLDWQELPNKKASRIALFLENADPADETEYQRLHAWMLDKMQRFRKAFGPRVKALDLDIEYENDEDEEARD